MQHIVIFMYASRVHLYETREREEFKAEHSLGYALYKQPMHRRQLFNVNYKLQYVIQNDWWKSERIDLSNE